MRSTSGSALDAFEAFADVYDAFTVHHDYELWTGAIARLAAPYGFRGPRLLDVGCGTGKSFAPYLDRGWSVTGCDQSPRMLRGAASRSGGRAALSEADARALPVLGAFDVVQALDDVVNHLAPDELAPAFAGLAANLAPGGVCVFDLNTVRAYRTFFASDTVVGDDEHVLVWQGRAAAETFAEGDVAEASFDAFTAGDADGSWSRSSALHRQWHHPLARVREALEGAGLAMAGAFGQDYACRFDAHVDELKHTKSLVIARHASAPEETGR